VIALNAGAAIYVAGVARTLADGVRMAEDLVHNGEARERMIELSDFTALLKRKDAEQQAEQGQS
jgi:anthranilate phosphoribosyltransferase